ncbi:MAG: hypothetical protein ABWY01_05510, partial [Pseudoxanthomonas sp.]
MDPNAVTIHDSSDIAPTCAMLAGSMITPDPIMFTATSTVSCIKLIFFGLVVFITWPLRVTTGFRSRWVGDSDPNPSVGFRYNEVLVLP